MDENWDVVMLGTTGTFEDFTSFCKEYAGRYQEYFVQIKFLRTTDCCLHEVFRGHPNSRPHQRQVPIIYRSRLFGAFHLLVYIATKYIIHSPALLNILSLFCTLLFGGLQAFHCLWRIFFFPFPFFLKTPRNAC